MLSLTARQSRIMRLLLNRSDFMTIRDLSDVFSVSERTIRNDLSQIRLFLKENGVELKSVPNKGIRIAAEKEEILRIEKQIQESRYFSNEERNDLVICCLLSSDVSTYEQLAEAADVSRYTIVHSINDIERKLKEFDLSLEKNKGKGISLKGGEYGFRMAFERLSLENDFRDVLFEKATRQYFAQENYAEALKMIEAVEKMLKVSFYNSRRLAVVLSFALYRMKRGFEMDALPEKVMRVKKDEDFHLYLDALSSFGLKRNEDLYVSSVFMNSKVRNLKKSEEDKLSKQVSRFLMEELEKLHGLSGEERERFLLGLTSHLDVALYRIRNDIPIRNSLKDQIRICLPLTYDFTKKQLLKCEEKFGICFNEDEISYIAMYVGSTYETSIKLDNRICIMLVCSVGMATSSILESRVKGLLPDCSFIGPFSSKEALAYLKDHEVDLILSTNDEDYGDVKTIVVNPLLYKQDIDYIRAVLFEINYDKLCSSFLDSYSLINEEGKKKVFLKQYIPKEHIQIVEGVKDWRESIRIAAKPLLKDGKIEKKYVDMMIRLVEEFGTYMVILPQTAFVHAAGEDGIFEECCSLLVMKKPLVFGDNNPKMVRNIVVVGVKDKRKMMVLDLADILSRKKNLNYLKSTNVTAEGIGELSDC